MGSGSGSDRARQSHRPTLHARRADRRACRARTAPPPAGSRGGEGGARLGRPDRRVRDHKPFVGTAPGGGVHFAAGYSGNSVGPSWIAGQALASLALGRDDEWTRIPLVHRKGARVPREPFRFVGGAAIRAAILACEEAEEAGRREPLVARAVGSLPRLLGMKVGTR